MSPFNTGEVADVILRTELQRLVIHCFSELRTFSQWLRHYIEHYLGQLEKQSTKRNV